MAQNGTTVLGQVTSVPSRRPLDANDHGIGPYTTCHLVHLVAIVHVAMTYYMVVNHGTTLSITSLQVLHSLFIPITRMASPSAFNTSLPLEAHTSLR
jgi:hypothetical protein